jgi:hypothetical protein
VQTGTTGIATASFLFSTLAITTHDHQYSTHWITGSKMLFTGKNNVAWCAEWTNSCMHVNCSNGEVVFMTFHELKIKINHDDLTSISTVKCIT